MKIKVNSSELNRMMKTISKCIGNRDMAYGNIEVIYDNNMLTLRGTNGQFAAVMYTPVMGGDGETFGVDGEMFGKVCALCKGDVEIVTEGSSCIIRGAGRTRLPIVKANIPNFVRPDYDASAKVLAQDFAKCFSSVEHAICTDQSNARIALTGVNVEIGDDSIKMVTLDGFMLAIESAKCSGEDAKMIVPGAFMRLIKDSTVNGEEITLTTDGHRIMAQTEGMMIACPLLISDFPDYNRILPTDFRTECLVDADNLRTILKNSAVVCSANKLVKFEIEDNHIKISGNSEQADYEAVLECETRGENLKIAFNLEYILDTIGSVGSEEIIMKFNTPSSPCVVRSKTAQGIRLVLPVRVMG